MCSLIPHERGQPSYPAFIERCGYAPVTRRVTREHRARRRGEGAVMPGGYERHVGKPDDEATAYAIASCGSPDRTADPACSVGIDEDRPSFSREAEIRRCRTANDQEARAKAGSGSGVGSPSDQCLARDLDGKFAPPKAPGRARRQQRESHAVVRHGVVGARIPRPPPPARTAREPAASGCQRGRRLDCGAEPKPRRRPLAAPAQPAVQTAH